MDIMRFATMCGAAILVAGCGMLPSSGSSSHARHPGPVSAQAGGACTNGSCSCRQGAPSMDQLHRYPPAADRGAHQAALTASRLAAPSQRPMAIAHVSADTADYQAP
jgi:hypothetical protein